MNGYDALTAARDSAYWAAAAALAAWLIGMITLVVNGGGILLLYRQLKISEDAALAARDAVRLAASETRPWLQVSLSHAEGQVGANQHLRVQGHLVISNIGKTPAMNVWIGSRLLVQPVRGEVNEAFEQLRGEDRSRRPVIFPGQEVTTTSYDRVALSDNDFGKSRDVKLAILVRYFSANDSHETPVLLDVWPSEDDVGQIIGWTLVPIDSQALDSSSAYDHPGSPS